MTSSIARRLAVATLSSALLVAGCSKPSADERVKKGDEYVAKSQPNEAIIEYKAALQIDARRGDVRTKLADLYMANRDVGPAIKEYVKAADLLPTDAKAQLQASRALMLAGQYTDAKTRAEKGLELDPKSAEAHILIGNALAGMKDLDGAIAGYHDAIALNPGEDASYANLGAVQLAKGNPKEAEAMFRKAVEVAPKSIPAHLALANFFWATRRIPESEQEFKAALALDPANTDANRALGIFYMSSNRAAEAEPYFQTLALSENPDAVIALADYYVYTKRYDDARKVLRDLAGKPASYAVASLRLAAVDATDGQIARALTVVREVLNKYPRDASARLFEARLLLIDGKRDEALKTATALVKEQPDAPVIGDAQLLLGGIYASLDRIDDAINAYQEVLKAQVQPLAANLALGVAHLRIQSLDKAQTYAQQALALQPDNPGARVLQARIFIARGELKQGAELIAGLEKQFPQSPTVLNLVALQHVANNRFDAARAAYNKTLRLAPADFEATSALVQMDLATGRTSEAVARIDAALKVPGTSTAPWLMLAGTTYATAGNGDKSEQALQRAIEADPSRLQAYGLLAQLYLRQNRLDAAKQRFEQMLERNPQSVGINTLLGVLLDQQGKSSEAETQYRKVLALDPHAAVAANNLAWIMVAGNKNLDEALQLARTAYDQLPDEPNVNDTLGWIYYHKNMSDQAVKHLQASVGKGPSILGFYHLGMAYFRNGEPEKAKIELQKALAPKRNFDGADEARKTLAAIG